MHLCYTRRMSRAVTLLCAMAAALSAVSTNPAAQTPSIDAAFDAFWAAGSREEAARRVEPIVKSRVAFDDVYRRLRRGRPYGAAPTGVVRLTNRSADGVERRYNVDENRIVVSGVSDGGTGAFYVAMRETTPFAAFLPLNGYLLVLAARDIDDGQIFANNLRNKPIFAVNGGRDPLYPTRVVDPTIEHMKKGGVSVDYDPQPNAGHNTAWWPEVKDTFEAFVRDHPRTPLPDTLTWEVGNSVEHHRAHWLVIERLGAQKSDAALSDLNDMAPEPTADFGARGNGTRVNRVIPRSNAGRLG